MILKLLQYKPTDLFQGYSSDTGTSQSQYGTMTLKEAAEDLCSATNTLASNILEVCNDESLPNPPPIVALIDFWLIPHSLIVIWITIITLLSRSAVLVMGPGDAVMQSVYPISCRATVVIIRAITPTMKHPCLRLPVCTELWRNSTCQRKTSPKIS